MGSWHSGGAVSASEEDMDGNQAIMSELSEEELAADIREDGAEKK